MHMGNTIAIFDPSSGSVNLGDKVIYEACTTELLRLAPDSFVFPVSLHQPLTRKIRNRIAQADLAVVAGSNMLNTRLGFGMTLTRWRFSLRDALVLKNVVLMGAGWNRKTDWVNPIGSRILRLGLSSTTTHSVRDKMTLKKAARIGLQKVSNTSCPTLWAIGEGRGHVRSKPKLWTRAVTTLTFNGASEGSDALMLKTLTERFKEVFFWPQGMGDLAYFRALNPPESIRILPGTINSYDRLLTDAEDLIYVGTRLHGGIRALQAGRAALIIEIDHRAGGVGRSSGIFTLPRNRMEELAEVLIKLEYPNLTLPTEDIAKWRDDVRRLLSGNRRR